MTQPSPHYHFLSHLHLQDTQMLRNSLIWHPQTRTMLQPAFISVSSTQGVITNLNRDISIADQYYTLSCSRVLYSLPRLTTGIQWIWWIPVDFQWIQQDYIVVIKRLQIYPVDPVDSWWIVVDLWWITGGLLVDSQL